jgi:hypothetical protein
MIARKLAVEFKSFGYSESDVERIRDATGFDPADCTLMAQLKRLQHEAQSDLGATSVQTGIDSDGPQTAAPRKPDAVGQGPVEAVDQSSSEPIKLPDSERRKGERRRSSGNKKRKN